MADIRAVDVFRVVTNEVVVIERHEQRAVIIGNAEIHAAGRIHHDRPHPIRARAAAGHGNAGEKTVALIEREKLGHVGQACGMSRDGCLVAIDQRPRAIAKIDPLDITAAQSDTAVKSGNDRRIFPEKGGRSHVQIIFEPHVGIRHHQEIACLPEGGCLRSQQRQ